VTAKVGFAAIHGPFVCVGDVMTDVVAELPGDLVPGSDRPAPIRLQGGGSAANTAAWLAAAGVPVTLVGRIGDDDLGERNRSDLTAAGVELALAVDVDRPSGCCVVLVSPDGERTMVPDAGANAAFSADDIPGDLLAAAGHLHLSGYPLFGPARPAALAALAAARRHGLTISVDAASSGPITDVGPAQFLDWLGSDLLLFANRDEATTLTGEGDPGAAGTALAARVGRAVVKLGAGGALWADDAGVIEVPTTPVDVRDSTGAGDAFAAGVLAALAQGRPVADALPAGHRLAGQACRRIGGRP
jgi:sugar/nucleoside kinase (ribokinase family)